MQQINSILIETNDLVCSFIKFLGGKLKDGRNKKSKKRIDESRFFRSIVKYILEIFSTCFVKNWQTIDNVFIVLASYLYWAGEFTAFNL